MFRNKFLITSLVSLALLLILVLVYLTIGPYKTSFIDVINTLLGNGTRFQKIAIFDLRLPRLLVGVFVAIGLSTAGCILQTIAKNDIADSNLIGINSGAALGAVIYITVNTTNFYTTLGNMAILMLPIFSIIGAVSVTLILYLLSNSKDGINIKRLLLIGVGLNAGATAFVTFLTFRGGTGEYERVLRWMNGSLESSSYRQLLIVVPFILAGFIFVMINYKKLNLMHLSDESCISLGLDLKKERIKFLIVVVLLVAISTAFTGSIAFVGLLSPHIAKKLVGTDHKKFIPLAAIISVILILIADLISKTMFAPTEIPIGVTVSLIGVPYFVYLIIKE